VKLLEGALESHQAAGDEPAIAAVAAELGRLLYFEGRRAEAIPNVERALELSERLRLSVVVVQALINKALLFEHRPNESVGLMRQALVLADESGDERGVLRACMNLSYLLSLAGRLSEAEEVIERGIALARRRGDRARERGLATNLVSTYLVSGRWDDAERVADELPEEGRISSDPVQASMMLDIAVVALRRGDTEKVRELATEYATWDETAYAQAMGVRSWARTLVAQAENRHDDALAESLDGLRDPSLNASRVGVELMLQHGGDSALAIGSADALAELLELGEAAPIDPTPTVRAALALQRARLAVVRDDDDPPYAAAINAQRESHDPFWVATALLEHGEWLTAHSRADEAEPILAEARETFERLRVAPMLERLNGIETPAAAQVSR
jgi:tetratricopeptide (TPR) repeat protein